MDGRSDFISPEGLRVDGRRPAELRAVRCKMSPVSTGDGSAFFEMGNTKVLAVVYGPREPVQRSQVHPEHAVITCEFSMAAFATGERRKRGKGDRRSAELATMLRQTLESAVLVELYPRTQIHVFVQVLQADGGTRSACFNAAVMALVDAGVAMRDLLASCSVGYLEGTPLLDLNHTEESSGGADVCIAAHPSLEKVAFLHMENKIPLDAFEQVMTQAMEGCKALGQYMRTVVLESTSHLLAMRGATRS